MKKFLIIGVLLFAINASAEKYAFEKVDNVFAKVGSTFTKSTVPLTTNFVAMLADPGFDTGATWIGWGGGMPWNIAASVATFTAVGNVTSKIISIDDTTFEEGRTYRVVINALTVFMAGTRQVYIGLGITPTFVYEIPLGVSTNDFLVGATVSGCGIHANSFDQSMSVEYIQIFRVDVSD